MIFKFKQFNIKQSDSAMKVGTDSVLLGSLLEANNPVAILDIGTGTGLLALMMAQHFEQSKIDAIEIDELTFTEAKYNAAESKWNNRVTVHHQSLQEFVKLGNKYDLIITNPPYYRAESNYKITEAQRSKARQTKTLSFEELVKGIGRILADDGICWMVLPTPESEMLLTKALDIGLHLNHQIFVHSKLSKEYNRVIFSLSKMQKEIKRSTFVIYDKEGKYTKEYTDATMPFLLWKD